jgi:F-type H+-transporting ATPase subunit b
MRGAWLVVGAFVALLPLSAGRSPAAGPEAGGPTGKAPAGSTAPAGEKAGAHEEEEVHYKITFKVLESLKKANVPESTLAKLAPLKGQEFDEHQFHNQLRDHLDKDELEKSEKDILHYAREEKPNPFSPALDLTIWSVLVFLLLFLVLWKFAWGPILQGLQKREQNIAEAVEQAKLAREEAQQAREQLAAQMQKANDEVRQLLDKAKRDADRLAAEVKAQAQADVQAERDRLRREIEVARDQALQALNEHAVNLATLISARALRREVNPDDHRRLVDDALADIGRVGRGRAALEGMI